MKEFLKLCRQHRDSDTVKILSVTSVTDGYLLAVRYDWNGGDSREDAVFITEEMYGPNKGRLSLGWTHIMYENNIDPL